MLVKPFAWKQNFALLERNKLETKNIEKTQNSGWEE
jgi:hypothetical protein